MWPAAAARIETAPLAMKSRDPIHSSSAKACQRHHNGIVCRPVDGEARGYKDLREPFGKAPAELREMRHHGGIIGVTF